MYTPHEHHPENHPTSSPLKTCLSLETDPGAKRLRTAALWDLIVQASFKTLLYPYPE